MIPWNQVTNLGLGAVVVLMLLAASIPLVNLVVKAWIEREEKKLAAQTSRDQEFISLQRESSQRFERMHDKQLAVTGEHTAVMRTVNSTLENMGDQFDELKVVVKDHTKATEALIGRLDRRQEDVPVESDQRGKKNGQT